MSSSSVPIHGNYHGYYSKRPSHRDPRLALLPQDFFKGKRVLDVGCNEGWVTCEIAQTFGASEVVGVDIDDSLIRAAWRRRRTVWSLQAPPDVVASSAPSHNASLGENGHDRPKKRAKKQKEPPAPEPDILDVDGFFPASCEHMHGPLPIPNPSVQSSDDMSETARPAANPRMFPFNVTFRTADWVQDDIPEDAAGPYDIILALSITKWIHLNAGDAGLRRFFTRVHAALRTGGTFVVEPQPWDTYAKARKMDATLRENAKGLQCKPEDFGEMLRGLGFGVARHLGATGEGGFRRPVDLYIKL